MTRFPYHTLYCQVRIGGYQKGAVLNLKGVVVGREESLLKSLSRESTDTDSPSGWVQKL